MQRYFATSVSKENIILDEKDIHHLLTVMRARLADKLIAIYEGNVYLGELVSIKPCIIKNLGEKEEMNRELEKEVTLFFALAKGDKIDFVIQKATELGVKRIALIKTEHCVVKMDNDDLKKKIENRYARIAKEASEQSERRYIPEIVGVYDIKNLPEEVLSDVNLVAYERLEEKTDFGKISEAKSISVLIGPEGGLSKDEVKILLERGFKAISLGKRILRTETAAVAALAMINMVIEK